MLASTLPAPRMDIAALSIPERMLVVIRRFNPFGDPDTGPSVSLDDFREAEETCDLTESQISIHMGAAKRLARQAAGDRVVEPIAPVMPWAIDPDYRKERVRAAAAHLAGVMPSETERFAHLRRCNFDADELGALWDEIHTETVALFGRQRSGVMARIIVDLTLATNEYERRNILKMPAMSELVKSMRVALEAIEGKTDLPRAHVLQTVRGFVVAAAAFDMDPGLVEAARKAYATLSDLWGK